MIIIDNTRYHASWVSGDFEQTADILNGDDSGRLQGTKEMYLEYIGTFFNCKGTLHRDKDCTDAQWDELYRALANPVNRHTIRQPFDQGVLVSDMYISKAARTLIKTDLENKKHKWSSTVNVQFTAISSKWLADDNLLDYNKNEVI